MIKPLKRINTLIHLDLVNKEIKYLKLDYNIKY